MAEKSTKLALPERIHRRDFGDREVIEALDDMSVDAIRMALASPFRDGGADVDDIEHATGSGLWTDGQPGRPVFADDDPAVMQAIARCAAYQVRMKLDEPPRFVLRAHPAECAWCGIPLEEMLRACDWSVVMSRFVIVHLATWFQFPENQPGHRGLTYRRSGPLEGTYRAARYADFWALPADQREPLVRAAMYPPTMYPEGVPA